MGTITIPFLILLIAFIISIVLLLVLLFQELQNIKLERRFESFSMQPLNNEEPSFMDILFTKILKIIKKFTQIEKKSVVLKKWAKKYTKYCTSEEIEEMDYISIKFLLGFFLLFLNTIFHLINKADVMVFLLAFLIGFFIPDIVLLLTYQKKKHKQEDDLLNAIMIMNNSFKSGKNIMQAIATVMQELDGPIALEFKKIYMDITYGLSLEVVFERFYDRVKLEDAKYIASSLTLLNKTGGNIVEVFKTIEKNFFLKKQMQDELNSLTSASIFVFRILITLPIIFSLLILILNPTYFNPLFQSAIGIGVFILIILLYILYIRIIKKVMQVKM